MGAPRLPRLTAGFANDVDAVNQYAATMYAATASGVIAGRVRPTQITTPSRQNVATALLISMPEPARTVWDQLTTGSSNIAFASIAPAIALATCATT